VFFKTGSNTIANIKLNCR